jgi:putative nucleotidyltransferase with HDIG domain
VKPDRQKSPHKSFFLAMYLFKLNFKLFKVRSLNAKFSVFVLALLSASVISSYFVTIQTINRQVKDSIVKRAESLSRSIASAAGYHLILKDLLALDNMVYKIKTVNPDITSIAIIGVNEEIIVNTQAEKAGERLENETSGPKIESLPGGGVMSGLDQKSSKTLIIESPVLFLDKNLGRVRLEVDWSVLHLAQSNARRQIVPFFALILFLGLALSFIFSRQMTRPVRELARGVEEMKRQGKSQQLRVYSSDELGRLTTSFNEMANLLTDQQEKLAASARELEEAYVSTVKILAAAIEARDRYTLGHSTRVAELAVALAKEAGLKREEVDLIEIACLFHDVGKIRIPDSILHKRGRLETEEIKEMQKHPEYGAEILSKAPCLYKYIPAVRHHHEWYNGNGYPDGLSREEIPVAAAIISLADAFDAMTSDRPYRKALSVEEARLAILKNSGRQFHPELAKLMIKIIEQKEMAENPAENQERPV